MTCEVSTEKSIFVNRVAAACIAVNKLVGRDRKIGWPAIGGASRPLIKSNASTEVRTLRIATSCALYKRRWKSKLSATRLELHNDSDCGKRTFKHLSSLSHDLSRSRDRFRSRIYIPMHRWPWPLRPELRCRQFIGPKATFQLPKHQGRRSL